MPAPHLDLSPSEKSDSPESTLLLEMRVDAGRYTLATRRILDWALAGESRYVCVANVHMVMEARADPSFRAIVNGASMVTSDGMPLVWVLRSRGFSAAERVYGPTLMLSVCQAAADEDVPVALFGGRPEVNDTLAEVLGRRFPKLRIVYRHSPPFGSLDAKRDDYAERIAASGARIVFVGLGCPKQERWMASMQGRLPAVAIGVGAAFDFHAGKVRQSPALLQRAGLEWLFRLAMEPRRLWRRYLILNPLFVACLLREETRRRFARRVS